MINNIRATTLLWKQFNYLGNSNTHSDSLFFEELIYKRSCDIQTYYNTKVPKNIEVINLNNDSIDISYTYNNISYPKKLTDVSRFFIVDTSNITVSNLLNIFNNNDISVGSTMNLFYLNRNYSHLTFNYRLQLHPLDDSNFSWWATDPSNINLEDFNKSSTTNNLLEKVIPRLYDPITLTYNFSLEFYRDNIDNFNTDICGNNFIPIPYYAVNNDRLDTWTIDTTTGYIIFMNDTKPDDGKANLKMITTKDNWTTNTASPPFFTFISYDGNIGFNNTKLEGTINISGDLIVNSKNILDTLTSGSESENGFNLRSGTSNIHYNPIDYDLIFQNSFNRFPIYSQYVWDSDLSDGTLIYALTTNNFNFFYNANINEYITYLLNKTDVSHVIHLEDFFVNLRESALLQFRLQTLSNYNLNYYNNHYQKLSQQLNGRTFDQTAVNSYSTIIYFKENPLTNKVKFILGSVDSVKAINICGENYNITIRDYWSKEDNKGIQAILDNNGYSNSDAQYINEFTINFLSDDQILDYSKNDITIRDILSGIQPLMKSFFLSSNIMQNVLNNLDDHDYSYYRSNNRPIMICFPINDTSGIIIDIEFYSDHLSDSNCDVIYGIDIYDSSGNSELVIMSIIRDAKFIQNSVYSTTLFISNHDLDTKWNSKYSRNITGSKNIFGIDLRIFIAGRMEKTNKPSGSFGWWSALGVGWLLGSLIHHASRRPTSTLLYNNIQLRKFSITFQ